MGPAIMSTAVETFVPILMSVLFSFFSVLVVRASIPTPIPILTSPARDPYLPVKLKRLRDNRYIWTELTHKVVPYFGHIYLPHRLLRLDI